MLTPANCQAKYGAPGGPLEGRYMANWIVPADIRAALAHVIFSALGKKGFPERVYANKALHAPLEAALRNVIARGLAPELKTWDGCYIVRKQRGAMVLSIHSWGLAVDVNQATNGLGDRPTLSAAFVKCFTDAGFEWGGYWQRKDGMHFQLAKLPS